MLARHPEHHRTGVYELTKQILVKERFLTLNVRSPKCPLEIENMINEYKEARQLRTRHSSPCFQRRQCGEGEDSANVEYWMMFDSSDSDLVPNHPSRKQNTMGVQITDGYMHENEGKAIKRRIQRKHWDYKYVFEKKTPRNES